MRFEQFFCSRKLQRKMSFYSHMVEMSLVGDEKLGIFNGVCTYGRFPTDHNTAINFNS